MNHLEFIEKNVREALEARGYPPDVARGGRDKLSIYTVACRKRPGAGGFTTTFCSMRWRGRNGIAAAQRGVRGSS